MTRIGLGAGALIFMLATQARASEVPNPPPPGFTVKAVTTVNASTPWLNQIALPTTTVTGAKGGQGVVIGVVDTGIVANNAELAGRVSVLSSCAALSFSCSNGVTDDNGHGTAVAAIAAGAYTGSTAQMSGVAPGVTIVAEKAMNAAGSGAEVDIANGIIKAADAGATVINLSLTYAPTTRIAAAMQYAALKGAVLVYAGGNEGVALLSSGPTSNLTQTPLSQTTLSHLIFVGSVNSANGKSSFSNTPGIGAVTAAGTTRTVSYQSLWIMAPGENVAAPAVTSGSNAFSAWSGTSMAAPMVTGAVALLQKTWPVLTRNGTAPAVLLASATDLGASGADATYGVGLLNLTRAFSPLGALSAVSPSGATVTLGSSSNATVGSATLGSLQALGAALANYTVFDGYSRNFSANLSSLLGRPGGTTVSLSSLVYSPVWTNALRLADGGQMQVYRDAFSAVESGAFDRRAYGLSGSAPPPPINYMAYVTPRGVSVAGGYGLASTTFYDGALWGDPSRADLRIGGLSALADGGYSVSLGAPLSQHLRVAAGWSQTPDPTGPFANRGPGARTARAASLGLAVQGRGPVSVGVKLSTLDETSGLLGAAYGPASALNFGQGGVSYAADVSAVIDLGAGRRLTLEAVQAKTPKRAVTQGLISRVSDLESQGYGLALTLPSVAVRGDRLTLAASRPLHLRSGSVTLAQIEVDEEGYSHTRLADISLKGGPPETDFTVAYARSVGRTTSFQADLTWRDHPPQAASDIAFRAVIQRRF